MFECCLCSTSCHALDLVAPESSFTAFIFSINEDDAKTKLVDDPTLNGFTDDMLISPAAPASSHIHCPVPSRLKADTGILSTSALSGPSAFWDGREIIATIECGVPTTRANVPSAFLVTVCMEQE